MFPKESRFKSSTVQSFLKFLIIFTVSIVIFNCIGSLGVFAKTPENQAEFIKAYNHLSGILRQIALFLLGFSVISGVATTIFHLIRLGHSGQNPQARAKVLSDLFTTLFCVSLLGAINWIVYMVLMFIGK